MYYISGGVKKWEQDDYYNVDEEFNRIEENNQYVDNWFKNYYKINTYGSLRHDTSRTIESIPYYTNFVNLVKNINLLTGVYNSDSSLVIEVSNKFDLATINKIEEKNSMNLAYLGNKQFENKICGLSICGEGDNVLWQ